jgi:hypothetical protein
LTIDHWLLTIDWRCSWSLLIKIDEKGPVIKQRLKAAPVNGQQPIVNSQRSTVNGQ